MRTGQRGKAFLEAITDREVGPNLNQKTPASIIPLLGDSPLRVVQKCELAKNVGQIARAVRHKNNYQQNNFNK